MQKNHNCEDFNNMDSVKNSVVMAEFPNYQFNQQQRNSINNNNHPQQIQNQFNQTQKVYNSNYNAQMPPIPRVQRQTSCSNFNRLTPNNQNQQQNLVQSGYFQNSRQNSRENSVNYQNNQKSSFISDMQVNRNSIIMRNNDSPKGITIMQDESFSQNLPIYNLDQHSNYQQDPMTSFQTADRIYKQQRNFQQNQSVQGMEREVSVEPQIQQVQKMNYNQQQEQAQQQYTRQNNFKPPTPNNHEMAHQMKQLVPLHKYSQSHQILHTEPTPESSYQFQQQQQNHHRYETQGKFENYSQNEYTQSNKFNNFNKMQQEIYDGFQNLSKVEQEDQNNIMRFQNIQAKIDDHFRNSVNITPQPSFCSSQNNNCKQILIGNGNQQSIQEFISPHFQNVNETEEQQDQQIQEQIESFENEINQGQEQNFEYENNFEIQKNCNNNQQQENLKLITLSDSETISTLQIIDNARIHNKNQLEQQLKQKQQVNIPIIEKYVQKQPQSPIFTQRTMQKQQVYIDQQVEKYTELILSKVVQSRLILKQAYNQKYISEITAKKANGVRYFQDDRNKEQTYKKKKPQEEYTDQLDLDVAQCVERTRNLLKQLKFHSNQNQSEEELTPQASNQYRYFQNSDHQLPTEKIVKNSKQIYGKLNKFSKENKVNYNQSVIILHQENILQNKQYEYKLQRPAQQSPLKIYENKVIQNCPKSPQLQKSMKLLEQFDQKHSKKIYSPFNSSAQQSKRTNNNNNIQQVKTSIYLDNSPQDSKYHKYITNSIKSINCSPNIKESQVQQTYILKKLISYQFSSGFSTVIEKMDAESNCEQNLEKFLQEYDSQGKVLSSNVSRDFYQNIQQFNEQYINQQNQQEVQYF